MMSLGSLQTTLLFLPAETLNPGIRDPTDVADIEEVLKIADGELYEVFNSCRGEALTGGGGR